MAGALLWLPRFLWDNRNRTEVLTEQRKHEQHASALLAKEDPEGGDEDEESEEEEMPEEFVDLPPDEQQSGILKKSLGMMGLGTILVVLFSDPMTDVLGELGNRSGIKPFYVSFVIAPLASNASEVIASFK